MSLSPSPTWGEPERIMPKEHWDWSIPVPFSQGWRCGPLVFVGGQIALAADGSTVGAGCMETQTRCVFENIRTVLAEVGAEMRHIVKLNTYYVCDEDGETVRERWAQMTKVRLEFLESPGPVGTAVRIAGLMHSDLLIEADAIAYVPELAER